MKPVTLITGASSGFGRALATLIADEGHDLALLARRENELRALAAELATRGARALVLPVDVSDREAVGRAVARCEQELGPISRLIANAGIDDVTAVTNFDAAMVKRIIDVNLMGAVYCLEAVMPAMMQRRSGHVVGIGSLAGYRGLPGVAAYCASKAGLWALLESLRIELLAFDVDVTVINPGFVKTPMTDRSRHPMPFLMELDKAAKLMHRAIRRRDTVYAFPWQLATITRLARFVPDALYDRVMSYTRAQKVD